jgi:hypothetical protein
MCGLTVTGPHFHHRKPRRAGGTRDPRVGLPSNGMYLHPACHERIESDRVESYRNGWLLAAAEFPDEVPVRRWDGWVFLVGLRAIPTGPPLHLDHA